MQSVKALESGGSEHEVVGSVMSWTLVVWRIWWIVALCLEIAVDQGAGVRRFGA